LISFLTRATPSFGTNIRLVSSPSPFRRRRSALPLAASCLAVAAGLPAALLAPQTARIAHAAGPSDIVPRGDIAYDLLGSLASAGRIPGYTLRDFARGDRLYTRREMADLIAILREDADEDLNFPERFATVLRVLEIKFGQELEIIRRKPARGYLTGKGAIAGSLKLRGLTDPEAGYASARFTGVYPVGRDGFAAVQIGSWRDEFYSDSGARKGFPPIETAMVRVNSRFLDFTVGKMPLRWGPGFVSPLLVSDESPSVPMIQVEKGFRLPGRLGARIGPLYFTQFAAQFYEGDDPAAVFNARGTDRYFFGRRIETNGTGRASFSLAESFKATRLPDAQWAVLLPFYTYQNDWQDIPGDDNPRWFKFLSTQSYPNTNWMNYMVDANGSYRLDNKGTTIYADFLIDDIKAPKGLGIANASTRRKLGGQLGAYLPNLGSGGRYALRLEFTTLDRGVYSSVSGPIAWSQNGLPLGYPLGGDANVAFGRLDAALSAKTKIALEGTVRRRKDSADAASPKYDRLAFFGTYNLQRNAFIGARVEHTRLQFPGASSDNRTRFELNVGAGF